VTLTAEGEVDYSKVNNKNVVKVMKNQEALVKVTLM
jgi:hypothetical protein